MSVETLFGPEEIPTKQKSRFRVIRPVFETLTIKENLPDYITAKTKGGRRNNKEA
jgi:hypothetical protein